MKKRILSFLLALLMVVSIFPAPAYATDSTDVTITPTETPTDAATEAACPTCGTVGCTSEHLTWCADCKKDDCGQNHCPTCGTIDCTTEHKICDKCGTLDCTADHTNWCADCKVDNCGQNHCPTCGTIDCAKEHKPCETCAVIDCTADHTNWCEICKYDNCGKDHSGTDTQPQDPSSDQVDAVSEDETTDPLVGRTATFNTDSIWLYSAPGALSQLVAKSQLPTSVVIMEVNGDYYRVDASNGAVWPSDYEQSKYVKSSVLTLDQEKAPCPVCGQTDCTTEHKQCEICEEYDCIKIHFWCELCEKHDCGKSHLICPVPDCGKVDCTENHTFCPHCGIYDCGMEHEDEYKPDTAPVIPNNPTLTPNADVSIVDEYGDAVIEDGLFLEDGTKTSISAWPVGEADSYQWQICYNNANDLWANIQGETGKGILISPAMFLNIISHQGTAAIRCVATVGGETKVSASIPVTVMEAVPQQKMMMFAARPGGENEAAPTADVEYSIVIDYKFRDGSKAANSWTASLAQGADYILDVESPAVVGYKPDQARITETITNFTGTRIITVYYDPDIVEFKVIHHQQNITGNEYTIYRTDTKQGYTGTQVGTDLQESFTGFDQLNYDETLVIAADGSTVVNIYYDREYYIVRLNLNGGFGSEPICARYGTPVNIADPQRTGYAFAGWSPALPSFVEKETSHTAQWTKANTGFTVAFWYENPNDKEYSFVGSVQQTATTGSKVNGADYKDVAFEGRNNEHFTYEKADTNVEIAADGSTVVNVYFARNSYTLTYYKWKCLHTHTNACCSLQHASHSDSCCSIPYHVNHTTGCVTNDLYKGGLYVPDSDLNKAVPNRYNGVSTTYKHLGATRYYVWFDGSWYRTANGSNGKDPLNWDCCRAGRGQYTHDHTSGCTCTQYHNHSSGRLSTCNNSACTHSAKYQCESDVSNMNHWTVFYQGTFKYGQDVSEIHAAQGIERWCPGACEGLKDQNGNYYESYGKSPAHGVYSSMGGGDVVFFQGGAGSTEYKLTFWLETYDGSGSRNYNGKNFAQGTTFTAKMGAVGYQGDYVAGCPKPGFTVFEAWTSDSIGGANGVQLPVGGSFSGSTYIYYNFYYARATYDLTYFNGSNVVATRTMKYEEPLTSSYNLQNLSMTSPYGNGYYFAGWYLDPECTIPVSWGNTRMPDGGMAVYAKWAPSTHKVTTYQTKGGTKLNTYNIVHGEAYSGTVDKPVNGVYNFVGWFYEEDGEKKSYDFSMPVYKDMVLWAEWTSDVQVSGTITYIDRATGKALAQFSPIRGQVGATKTYEAKVGSQLNATGYFPEVTSHNIEFSPNESQNNWIFYYNAMKDVPYEVRYINGATGEPMAASDFGTTNEPSLSFKAKTFKGYSADAYEKTLIVSSDETLNVVVFTYTEDTVHAPVQVVHYIQNTTGDGYNRYLTEEAYQGTIGQNQYKTPLNIDGFTYNETKSKNGMKLTEDGLQLELYYDRNTYSYKFLFEDTAGNTLRDAVEGSGLYGSLAEYTTQSISGYRLTTPGTLTITIGTNAENNVKTFVYEERTATIRYEVGAVKGGTVTPASEAVLAVNGTAVGAEAKTNTNYKFVGWYTDYACTEANKVGDNETFIPQKTADGVYADAVYYAKFEEVKVTLYYSVVMPDGAAAEATLTKTSEKVSIYTGRAAGSSVATVPDGYRFEGWYDADDNKLTGNTSYTPPRTDDPWVDGTTYYARFVEKKATINYVAVGNGAVSPGIEEVSMVTGTAFGATATATENIAQFVGWYDNAACEGAALSTNAVFAPALPSGGWAETQTYYAKFENIQYTITFEDRDSTLKTQSYVYGDTLTLPDVANGDFLVTWTVKETSGDWEQDAKVKNGVINHYGNVTLVANWTIMAVWIDSDFKFTDLNGDILDNALEDALFVLEDVPYGTTPVYAGTLTTDQLAARKNDDKFTYAFKEWAELDLSVYEALLQEEIKGIVVYQAVYEKSVNKYTITWQDEDGNTIDTTEVSYGTIPTHEDPTKEATDEYTYTFTGWTPEVVAVTGEATYRATFTPIKRSYTITWLNDDDSVIDTTTVMYGEVPTHADPSKAATAEYTYTFSGWTPEVVAVTGEATYKATYTAEKNKYTIIWKNEDGTVLEKDTGVEYGTMPSYDGETPTKEPYNQFTYTFREWSPEIKLVTGDAVYTASFDPRENFYTVTWVNHDDTVLETDENVAWDTMPVYNGDTPEKAGNAEHSYSFAGWSPTVSKVNGHAIYTATFTESVNTYTVTWKNEDGTVLETDEYVVYGAMPSYDGETPEKAATAQYTYTFDGWDKEVVAVTGDVTYTAKFSATVNKYTVTFVDEDGTTILMAAAEYEYGTAAEDIVKPTDPTKEATAEFTYSFAGWTPEIADVTANVTYKAIYSEVKNQYTLSGEIDHGTVTDPVTVDYGTEATITFTPAAGYKFYSWKVNDGDATLITTPAKTWAHKVPEIKENKHVVVTMAPIEYNISYDLKGGELGTGTTNPTTYTVETETFTLNNPTKDGYKFLGWATSDTATTGDMTVTIEKGTTGDKTFYAIWERSLVDLTITATTADSEQSFIFTVSGTRSDGVAFAPIDVVLCSENNFHVTIKDMPVGEYAVTEKNGWSWRENAVESKTADLRTTSQTVSFDFYAVDDLHWLSGYSYKRKKGGS